MGSASEYAHLHMTLRDLDHISLGAIIRLVLAAKVGNLPWVPRVTLSWGSYWIHEPPSRAAIGRSWNMALAAMLVCYV